MKRLNIVKKIMDKVSDDDIVVTSTGYISREVYHYKDRDLNFYMMGSMGNALAIGIGLAYSLPFKNKVIVINGDASCLMSLGTLTHDFPAHLFHHILCNGMHESTGGQKINATMLDFFSINVGNNVWEIEPSDHVPERIPLSPKEITERFRNAIDVIRHK